MDFLARLSNFEAILVDEVAQAGKEPPENHILFHMIS